MSVAPEPILDIVRGLSTVASFAIVINQLKSLHAEFFVSTCDRCRGTGCLTCPHCHGTKTLRRRPGFLRTRDLAIVDNPGDSYECFYCGPPTTFDFDPMAADDEENALKIQENLKSAVSNTWPRPYEIDILAGTVPCTACYGSAKVRRLTPDIGKAFRMEEAWDFKIAKRIGAYSSFVAGPKAPQYLEYPASPPTPIELPVPVPTQKGKAGKKESADTDDTGFKLSHQSAFSLEDYVLNYASDDDVAT